MARGDYIEVIYRTGQGTEKTKVAARGIGGSVDVKGVDDRGTFITVEELNRVGEPIQTARFAKSEVVAIVEGSK